MQFPFTSLEVRAVSHCITTKEKKKKHNNTHTHHKAPNKQQQQCSHSLLSLHAPPSRVLLGIKASRNCPEQGTPPTSPCTPQVWLHPEVFRALLVTYTERSAGQQDPSGAGQSPPVTAATWGFLGNPNSLHRHSKFPNLR